MRLRRILNNLYRKEFRLKIFPDEYERINSAVSGDGKLSDDLSDINTSLGEIPEAETKLDPIAEAYERVNDSLLGEDGV